MERQLGLTLSWKEVESLSTKARKAYDKKRMTARKKKSAIWSEYFYDKFRANTGLFLAYLVYNNVAKHYLDIITDLMDTAKPRNDYGWYYLDLSAHEAIKQPYQDFLIYLNYDIVVNKGDIIVRSKCDNSIPFDLVEMLETYLGARRYHIG